MEGLVPSVSTQKHVGVFVFPFTSHSYTLLLLTRRLAASSPPTTTFSFFGTDKSNAAIFPKNYDEDYPNIRPFRVSDGFPEGYTPLYDPKRVGVQLETVDRFMTAGLESFRTAVVSAEAAVGCKLSCVVSAAFVWFAGELAAEMAVPWVVVNTCAPRHLVVAMNVDRIRDMVGTTTDGVMEKTLDIIPGFSTTRCKELPDGIAWGNLDSPFAHMIHKMGHTLHKSTAMVINSFEEIDPITTEYLKSIFHCCLHIGVSSLAIPPPLKDDYGCIPWLYGHGPGSVVYLSFGTFLTVQTDEVVAIVEALKEVGCSFLWSLKGNPKEKLPKDIIDYVEEKGKFVPWAPQLAIMNHGSVGVSVTHAGTNTLIESVVGGVPIIARPLFGDQLLNRAVVEDVWGVGQMVEGGRFRKDELVKALRTVLFSEEGKCMRARVCALKEEALKSMEQNGSSSRNFNSLIEIINK